MSNGTLAAGAAPAETPATTTNAAAASTAAAKPAPASVAGGPGAPAASGDAAGAAAAGAAAVAGPAAAAGAEPAAGDPPIAGPWGDDWREKIAGDDPKKMELLKRYASPEAAIEALDQANRRISQGLKPKGRPGAKATDEEWSTWRKENGIPDKVDDFVKAIVLPDKRQIGEADLPVVNAFAERAIKSGVSPADMSILVDEYYSMQEEIEFQQATKDADAKKAADKDLRSAWGGDYDANFRAMRPYFDGVDETLFDNLMGGRLADGSKIGDHPGVLKFFAAKAVAENPLATVIESGNTQLVQIEAEIAAMKKRMSEDRTAWFKDTAAQERYRQLNAALERTKKAGKSA